MIREVLGSSDSLGLRWDVGDCGSDEGPVVGERRCVLVFDDCI